MPLQVEGGDAAHPDQQQPGGVPGGAGGAGRGPQPPHLGPLHLQGGHLHHGDDRHTHPPHIR